MIRNKGNPYHGTGFQKREKMTLFVLSRLLFTVGDSRKRFLLSLALRDLTMYRNFS